jgi:voltage-gated potassium channel
VKTPRRRSRRERRERRRLLNRADPWRRLKLGFLVLLVVQGIGTIGYWVLGLEPFEAFYQTSITVTTVGFDEIGAQQEIDTAYRVFTLVLVLFGAGGVLYTLGVLVEAMVEGSINDGFRIRRNQRMIDRMDNHIVVAGAGRVGRAIAHYAARHGADVVIVDRQEVDLDFGVCLEGEATDDAVLAEAGIDRARILVAALNNDADNIYVTLTSRAVNPELMIVVRTNSQANEAKFFRAGADRVVNPHEIGGSRMAAIGMHPNVAEFMDEVLHDEAHDVEIEEVAVGPTSQTLGMTTEAVNEAIADPPLLVAVRGPGGRYVANPPRDTVIAERDVIIALGSAAQLQALHSFVEA